MKRLIPSALFLGLAWAGALSAATLRVPSQVPTLSSALNQAQDGDSVVVAPGVYSVSGLTLLRDITLMGEEPEALNTVLNGGGQRILTLSGRGPGTLVQGLVLRNGVGTSAGGGLLLNNCVGVRVQGCRFEQCGSTFSGGGLYAGASTRAVLRDCVFSGASSTNSTGSAIRNDGELILLGCRVTDHHHGSSAVYTTGGAILTALDCQFDGNSIPLVAIAGSGVHLFEQCRFMGNTTASTLLNLGNGMRRLVDCELADNQVQALISGRLRLEGGRLLRNQATGSLVYGDTLRLGGVLLAGNRSLSPTTSGLIAATRRLELEASTICFNESARSLLAAQSYLSLARSLLLGNRTGEVARGIWGTPPVLAVSCTGLYGNLGLKTDLDLDWSGLLEPFESVAGNWRGDPRLRDPMLEDFRPALGSPARPEHNACGVLAGALPPVDEAPAPLAWFSADPTYGVAPLSVRLRAWAGGDADAWAWDLDDDGVPEAWGQEVETVFTDFGAWPVTLSATGPQGTRQLRRAEALRVGGRLLRVPEDHATPAAALAAALPGDVVELADGDYWLPASLDMPGGVTLRAAHPRGARLRSINNYMPLVQSSYQALPSRVEGLELRRETQTYSPMVRCGEGRLELAGCRLARGAALGGSTLILEDCDLDSLSYVETDDCSTIRLTRCRLQDCERVATNSCAEEELLLEACLLVRCGNLATGSGGSNRGILRAHNCTLVDCGPAPPSTNVLVRRVQRLELDRCIVAASRVPLLGANPPTELAVARTTIHAGVLGDWVGPLAPLLEQDGNLDADPHFCDYGAGDFHLAATSPCWLDSLGQDHMGALGLGCDVGRPSILALEAVTVAGPFPLVRTLNARTLGGVATWRWDADGDGLVDGQEPTLTHSYQTPGIFRAGLQVANAAGWAEAWLPPVEVAAQVIRVPADQPTLGAAFDQATSGTLVLALPDHYLEHGLNLPAGVSLMGEGGIAVIDAQGQGRVLTLAAGAQPALLQDLELRQGSSTSGGGLLITPVDNNAAVVTIRRCRFQDNTAEQTGGAVARGGTTPLVLLDSCFFAGNEAGEGGALGGVGLRARSSSFVGNRAGTGGAWWNLDGQPVELCVFQDNEAALGGALALSGFALVRDCLFRGNRASGAGGAVWNAPWAASEGSRYEGCLFHGNRAGEDGAAILDRSGPRISFCTMAVDSTADTGGVLSLEAAIGAPAAILEHSIVAGARGGRAVSNADDRFTVACSDLWGNAHGNWDPPFAGQWGQAGNLEADPLFCTPDEGDFTLRAASPCRPGQSACGWMGALTGLCDESPLPAPALRPVALGLAAAPNPFNGASLIHYTLPRPAPVRLSLFNLLGQRVALLVDETRPAGVHTLRLEPRGWASGLYLLRLEQGGQAATLKVMLIE
jgi:hypothetical protein